MKRAGRWPARLALGLGILAALGFGYQQWGERRDARAYPMPGRLVNVGDHRLHIWCIGRGAPTLLMLSGSGAPTVSSAELQVRLAKISRVCSYDRAGLGWSDPPRRPMSLAATLADLDGLLAKSGERGPFVLVPESFGGLIAVITHGQPSDFLGAGFEATWPQAQRRWTRLSSRAVQVIAARNGHPIAQENPALVAREVEHMVAALRQ